jgi:hypothetical protein
LNQSLDQPNCQRLQRNPESTESLSPFAPEIDQRRIWRDHLELVRLATGERLFNQGDATAADIRKATAAIGAAWLSIERHDLA